MNGRAESPPDVRLLIVDDDEMVGQTIRRVAEMEGYEARFTSDPERFLELATEWSPDIVAVDLVMPGMDGVQLLNELAQRESGARIIITSGVGQRVLDAAGRSAREHGLNIAGVLPKPFMPGDLRKLLTEAARTDSDTNGTQPSQSVATITEELLREGIDGGQLVVQYQPKIHCEGHGLAGFEALVRWNHPELGMIPPNRFIPLAESCGLINPLTERVLEAALEWYSDLDISMLETGNGEGAQQVGLSINLSARSLDDEAMLDRIVQRCLDAGVQPQRISFELTETSAMQHPVTSLDLLTRMRMKGFQLSIDDFGTGYSSMLQLVRLPFSEIKVDKSFVISAAESEESRSVARSIIDLGRSLGLKTTAEGIEDEWTLEFICSLGCNYAQGFHIGRPEDGETVRARWGL